MTDWEARYQTGNMPWEKGQPAPPLLELFERREREIWGEGPVLVPGCGFGHDVRALATHGIHALGVDLAETAIERAREFPKVGGEEYELANFLDLRWREGRKFSAIWEHTCFCAIDPSQRPAYAEAAAGLLEPGGILAGVFFPEPIRSWRGVRGAAVSLHGGGNRGAAGAVVRAGGGLDVRALISGEGGTGMDRDISPSK